MQNENVFQILKSLSQVPNVPFLPKPRIEYLKDYFRKLNLDYELNDYALILRKVTDINAPKMVFMTHLDHPGFVLNGTKGIFFGSLGFKRENYRLFKAKLNTSNPSIKVFDSNGKYIDNAKLVNFSDSVHQNVEIEAGFEILTNSSGQWNVHGYIEKDDKLYLYSADNDVASAVMLQLINNINGDNSVKGNFIFVFNLYEEVHQLSSYYLAKNDVLKLSSNDFLINLESKEIFVDDTFVEKGLILQIGDPGCLYGYKFNDQNDAELLLCKVGNKNNIELITGISKGSCDARSFSNFKSTPNIVTLSVSTKYKHNISEEMEVVTEEVYKSDVLDMLRLLENVVKINPNAYLSDDKQGAVWDIKQNGDKVTNQKLMKNKKVLNERLLLAYKPWIKRGYVFPESLWDRANDFIFKVLSYLKYVFAILTLHA